MAAPLRIAIMLESDGPGGAETCVLRLSHELRSRGHYILPVGPARGEGWLGDQFRAGGFEPQTFSLSGPIDLGCLRRMVRMLRRHEIDVVHSHEFAMAVYGAAACRWLRRRHVITMHSANGVTSVWRRRAALRWAFRNSAAAVAVSSDTRTRLAHGLGIREELINVVLNGVPDDHAGMPWPVAEHDGGGAELVIMAVGTLIPLKGHIHLLEALRLLRERGFDIPWRLVIAGGRGGEERSRLEEFARAHGLDDRLQILTYRSDVPQLLRAADIFVMPSLREGLPMALLEAMLAARAVIASSVGGIPEAIVPERDGVLVPPADPAALASALERLMRNSRLRDQLGAAARARALREFTVSVMADGYESLYRRHTPDSDPAHLQPIESGSRVYGRR